MQDAMIKGTGNSRYLKAPEDLLARYPTWQDAAAAMIAGTFEFDLNGLNPNGWTQLGTNMNKANVLTDATATSLGLTSAATPNDAFAALYQHTQTPPVPAEASDLFLYFTGQHPVLCASPYSDFDYYRYMQFHDKLQRSISLTGNSQTITVYDGG